jgi:hypothetical protein
MCEAFARPNRDAIITHLYNMVMQTTVAINRRRTFPGDAQQDRNILVQPRRKRFLQSNRPPLALRPQIVIQLPTDVEVFISDSEYPRAYLAVSALPRAAGILPSSSILHPAHASTDCNLKLSEPSLAF